MILEALTLLAIGDSLTTGFHLTIDPNPIPWADQLAMRNVARGAATTWHWLPGEPGYYWRAQVQLPVDIAFVLLGSNDAQRPEYETTSEDFYWNMADLVDALLEDGAGLVVLLGPPDTRKLDRPDIEARLEAYHVEIQALCDGGWDSLVECGPDLRGVLDASHYVLGDLVHPNQFGQDAIAEAVEEWLLVPEVQSFSQMFVALLVLSMLRMVLCMSKEEYDGLFET